MKKLRLLRIIRNLTQIDLAHKSAVAASKLSLIECGRVAPSAEDLSRLSEALGVAKNQLMGDVEDQREMKRLIKRSNCLK
jgi:transcriptional regulator with XRE-family HTH domain